jgi:hypothetical protein
MTRIEEPSALINVTHFSFEGVPIQAGQVAVVAAWLERFESQAPWAKAYGYFTDGSVVNAMLCPPQMSKLQDLQWQQNAEADLSADFDYELAAFSQVVLLRLSNNIREILELHRFAHFRGPLSLSFVISLGFPMPNHALWACARTRTFHKERSSRPPLPRDGFFASSITKCRP